jgi:hypothetical protein
MKQFDLYDILGVLAPGTVLMLGLLYFYPERMAVLGDKNLSVGEFGAIVLLSYVAGNLIAALGSILEKPFWKYRGGYPTTRARLNKGDIITKDEFASVEEKLREKGILTDPKPATDLNPSEWDAVTRRIHSYLDTRSLTRRIEMFNAKFGMNRNVAVAFLLILIISIRRLGMPGLKIDIVLFACIVLAVCRTREFGLSYARSLFRSFLTSPESIPSPDTAKDDDA